MLAEFDRLAWDSYRELAPGLKIGSGKVVLRYKRTMPVIVHLK